MKRVLVGLLVVFVAGGVAAVVVRAWRAQGPVYSVAQIDARLRRDPASLVGRVVAVRGVVGFCPVRVGCPPNVPPVLIDHLGSLSAAPPLQLDFGPGDSVPALLRALPLIGGVLPAPRRLQDGYQGVLRVRIEPTASVACYTRLCYQGVLQDLAPP